METLNLSYHFIPTLINENVFHYELDICLTYTVTLYVKFTRLKNSRRNIIKHFLNQNQVIHVLTP